jgi:hypothetical protein
MRIYENMTLADYCAAFGRPGHVRTFKVETEDIFEIRDLAIREARGCTALLYTQHHQEVGFCGILWIWKCTAVG